MGIVAKIRDAMGFKALDQMRHPTGGGIIFGPSKPSKRQMARDVGVGTTANVLMSTIGYIQRNAAEAKPAMMKADGEPLLEHPLLRLLARPNPHYSWEHLLAGTILSWCTAGNGYWIIRDNSLNRPAELWWTPHWLIEPKYPHSGSAFISHYEYSPGGEKEKLDPSEVVHFRRGIDPENLRKGLSPLAGLLPEIWSDMEASSFISALLRNGAIPGLILSPRGEGGLDAKDAEAIKQKMKANFTGDRRGDPLVTTLDVRIEQFGLEPSKLDLSSVHDTAEERVCAALGIPPAVVGFGTGLQQTKVGATMKDMRKEAWHGGILPMLKGFAGEANRQLVPRFTGQGQGQLTFFFDTGEVPALAEDREKLETRANERLKSGGVTINEYRFSIGLDEVAGGDVFLRPFSAVEVELGASGRTIEGPDPAKKLEKMSEQVRRSVEQLQEAFANASQKDHDDDHEHSELERRVAETGRRVAKPPKSLAALAGRIDAIRAKSGKVFEGRLEKFFDALGKQAQTSVRRLAKKDATGEAESKDLFADVLNNLSAETTKKDMKRVARQIVKGMDLKPGDLDALYGKTFLGVAGETAGAIEGTLGIAVGVPDPVARAILSASGKRAGLIDLKKQSINAAFKGLTEAASAGMGPIDAARKIRDAVGAGPWSTPSIRAKVIARTEMAFATNVSSLELGKSLGAEEALIFDARLGSTDAICEALNGRVATMDDARGLMFDEHPNGTRSFSPIPPGMEL